jgi:hypothetical protein
MPDTRTVKKIFNWKPLTKRSQGGPKYRWVDNIKQDICQMKIKIWIPASRIEGSGKGSLRRPKLSTRKFSAWKKKISGGGTFFEGCTNMK